MHHDFSLVRTRAAPETAEKQSVGIWRVSNFGLAQRLLTHSYGVYCLFSISRILQGRRQASLHFCQECNNLLYPRADPQRRIMVFACRICQYDEIGENKCVYRNDLLKVTK